MLNVFRFLLLLRRERLQRIYQERAEACKDRYFGSGSTAKSHYEMAQRWEREARRLAGIRIR